LFLPTVPRPRLSVSEINPEGGQTGLPNALNGPYATLGEGKILFNPCLVSPIQDSSLGELTFFRFAALRGKQMAPTRLATQDFPGASYF